MCTKIAHILKFKYEIEKKLHNFCKNIVNKIV